MDPTLRQKLLDVLIKHDTQQMKGKHYNIYAMGHYVKGLQRVTKCVEHKLTIRHSLLLSFNDRLLDKLLKAADEKPYVRFEERGLKLPYDEDEEE